MARTAFPAGTSIFLSSAELRCGKTCAAWPDSSFSIVIAVQREDRSIKDSDARHSKRQAINLLEAKVP